MTKHSSQTELSMEAGKTFGVSPDPGPKAVAARSLGQC